MFNKTKSATLIGVVIVAVIAIVVYMVVIYAKPSNTEVVTVRIGFPIQSLDATPIILANEKGYFKDQNLNVSLMHLQSAEGVLAVGSGEVDLDVTGASRTFGPIAKGVPIKLLSIGSDMSSHLFVRPDSDIVTLKDLEGKKVSRGPAGSNVLKFTYILEEEGVDVSEIKFVDIDKLYLPTALMDQKVIDAALIDEPAYVSKAKELGAMALPYWYEKEYQKTPTGSSVVVNTDFLKDHEDEVIKFYKAIIEAHRYMKENLPDSATIITDYLRINTNGAMDIKPEEFVKQINEASVRYILWQDQTPIVEMARISYEHKLTDKLLTVEDLYDLRFRGLLENAQNEIYESPKN